MKKCLSCSSQQEEGKFCGQCGGALVAMDGREEAATLSQTNTESIGASNSIHVENVKKHSKQYWSYVIEFIKKPSQVFSNGEQSFFNGLITILLYAIMVAISLYAFIKSITKQYLGGFGNWFEQDYNIGPSFFSTFTSVGIFILLSILIVLVSLFIIGKIFGKGYSFKELVGYYGTHLLPIVALSIISLLLILIKSYMYGNILLSVTVLLALVVVPLYIIGRLLAFQSKIIDSFYSYLLYIVLFVVLFSILSSVVVDSTIGQYLDYFMEY